MKNASKIALLSVAAMTLVSCGQPKTYADHLEDYVHAMRYHDNFNILQLTDIHWSYTSSTASSRTYLDKLLAETNQHIIDTQGEGAKIDLVELTGDQFMLANAYHVESFVKYFEEKSEQYGFKYAVIWGNHDNHGIYNPNWLSDQFRKAKNAIYSDEEDDLYGRSNFVIDLTEDGNKGSAVKWQIANLDSGASFSETAVSPFRDYDYIRPEQTKWWKMEHDRANKTHLGGEVPSIAYYHIPQEENGAAWKEVQAGANYKNKFFKLEGFADNGNEKYASDFLDVASQHGLKAAFMGHAHNVDWTVQYMGITLGLGVKTGTELYYAHIDVNSDDPAMKQGLESVGINENFDLVGASLVTLRDDAGNFDLEHVYYNERASGDFVRWVKW